MEYDDRYNPADLNDIDDVGGGMTALSKLKKLNRGYHTIKRRVLINNKYKNLDFGVYVSGGAGSSIRNAETGEYCKGRVGSKDESMFFKVSNSTGESSVGPLTLFYDSPSQYENHFGIVLNDDVKYSWRDRIHHLAQN